MRRLRFAPRVVSADHVAIDVRVRAQKTFSPLLVTRDETSISERRDSVGSARAVRTTIVHRPLNVR